MSAILRGAARSASVDSAKADKSAVDIAVDIFATGLGGKFDAVFAVCVLLGALWLLISGYA